MGCPKEGAICCEEAMGSPGEWATLLLIEAVSVMVLMMAHLEKLVLLRKSKNIYGNRSCTGGFEF